jgi:mannose-1-phosphate guanylyltransferase
MAHHVVLLAGGSGTRFWPLSRKARPKQLLPLAGGKTLLRATYERVAPLFAPDRILCVTGQHLAAAVASELAEVPAENVIAEPFGRNTAPALGIAAAALWRRDPEAVLAVLPTDHHVADEAIFRGVLAKAMVLAAESRIVCLGIEPTRPETGFGYLEVEPESAGALRVVRFIEKPDLARAEKFLAERGRYLWNSGTFFFRADRMLAAFDRHLPAFAALLRGFAAGALTLDAVYQGAPSISIDHAVMEKETDLSALPLRAGWNDLGSWEALYGLTPPDDAGNCGEADLVAIDASRCVVHAPGKVVALLGVADLVVVDTPDALLVCPRDRAQDVRSIVDALARRPKPPL